MATFQPKKTASATLDDEITFTKGVNPSDTVPAESILSGLSSFASILTGESEYYICERKVTQIYQGA